MVRSRRVTRPYRFFPRMSYGGFHLSATLTSSKQDKYWKNAKYMIFDAALPYKPFEERYEILKRLSFPSFVQVVEQTKCRDQSHFEVMVPWV